MGCDIPFFIFPGWMVYDGIYSLWGISVSRIINKRRYFNSASINCLIFEQGFSSVLLALLCSSFGWQLQTSSTQRRRTWCSQNATQGKFPHAWTPLTVTESYHILSPTFACRDIADPNPVFRLNLFAIHWQPQTTFKLLLVSENSVHRDRLSFGHPQNVPTTLIYLGSVCLGGGLPYA